MKSKLVLKKKAVEEKVLTSHIFKGSRKDLINVAKELKEKLRKKNIEETSDYFKDLLKNQKYIKYKKHLGGCAHHCGLGPSRRPLKTYNYVIEVLKNLKQDYNNLTKNYFLNRVIVNLDTSKRLGGVISCGRSVVFRKDSRTAYLKFYFVKNKTL